MNENIKIFLWFVLFGIFISVIIGCIRTPPTPENTAPILVGVVFFLIGYKLYRSRPTGEEITTTSEGDLK